MNTKQGQLDPYLLSLGRVLQSLLAPSAEGITKQSKYSLDLIGEFQGSQPAPLFWSLAGGHPF